MRSSCFELDGVAVFPHPFTYNQSSADDESPDGIRASLPTPPQPFSPIRSDEIMNRSRLVLALAVFLASTTPLFLLSRVTDGGRHGVLTKIYDDADLVFPVLARGLWVFGPLDWWSYVTPLAFAVGVSARLRMTLGRPILSGILAFSLVQSLVVYTAFQPFARLGSVVGHPPPSPYPVAPLVVNVAMLIGAVLFAILSIRRNTRRPPSGSSPIHGGAKQTRPRS